MAAQQQTCGHSLRIRPWMAAAGLVGVVSMASATELLVPAYFYPSFDPAQNQWPQLTAALQQGAKVTAIVNMANGPGAGVNADYVKAIDDFRAAGGRVLGYDYTCYGRNLCTSAVPQARSVSEVLADAERYASWYHVDGIFLDEMSDGAADLPFYSAVSAGLRQAHPAWQLVGNPGAALDAGYAPLFDTFVTYEQGTASFATATSQPWLTQAAPNRQASILYNVTGEAAMQSLLAQAVARGAGYVYITDDRYTPGSTIDTNPFDKLPSYWQQEAKLVASVPEPASLSLMAAGVLALLLRQRRHRASGQA
jgi:hypothetical protein